MYVTHTGKYTVLLQKKEKLKSFLPCAQGCFFLLILFSDCITLSQVAMLFLFTKIPKSVTQSSPLLKENRIDKN